MVDRPVVLSPLGFDVAVRFRNKRFQYSAAWSKQFSPFFFLKFSGSPLKWKIAKHVVHVCATSRIDFAVVAQRLCRGRHY
jgi:hypothetical protein